MAARKKRRGETRYGLAVFASNNGIDLSAYVAGGSGVLTPISEEELQEKAPEWHAVLLFCRAVGKVRRSVADLPPQTQRGAGVMVQIASFLGGLNESPQVDNSQVQVED